MGGTPRLLTVGLRGGHQDQGEGIPLAKLWSTWEKLEARAWAGAAGSGGRYLRAGIKPCWSVDEEKREGWGQLQ